MPQLCCVKMSDRYLYPFGLLRESIRTKSFIYIDREFTFSLLGILMFSLQFYFGLWEKISFGWKSQIWGEMVRFVEIMPGTISKLFFNFHNKR